VALDPVVDGADLYVLLGGGLRSTTETQGS